MVLLLALPSTRVPSHGTSPLTTAILISASVSITIILLAFLYVSTSRTQSSDPKHLLESHVICQRKPCYWIPLSSASTQRYQEQVYTEEANQAWDSLVRDIGPEHIHETYGHFIQDSRAIEARAIKEGQCIMPPTISCSPIYQINNVLIWDKISRRALPAEDLASALDKSIG